MPKILTIDEMLEALYRDQSPDYRICVALIEDAATEIAQAVCHRFNVDMDELGATFEGLSFAGTACSFYAKHDDQPLPENLKPYDPGGDWETNEI